MKTTKLCIIDYLLDDYRLATRLAQRFSSRFDNCWWFTL